jgi:glucose/arabinose dehydrogenase
MRHLGVRPALLALTLVLVEAPAAESQLAGQAPGPARATAADPAVHTSGRHAFRVVTVAEGLDHPWSMAWLPNGDMLVTERAGRLRIVRGGRLLPEPVAGVPRVRARGQGGLLDVALHPQFVTNRLLYLSFAKPSPNDSLATTAVVRGRLENDRLVDVQEIFEAKAWAAGSVHFAGKMAFDRAGFLYLTVGDRGENPNLMTAHPAQSLAQHQGKVLRLHDDGRVPADNPFAGRSGAMPEIWSYGHRNLQGLAVHPQTGEVWENEHGPRGGDEVNFIRTGANYGWPVVSYGINYDGSPYTRELQRAGIEAPRWTWVPSIATSGMLFYSGDQFPWWRGSLFVGGLVGRQLARLTLDGERVVSEEAMLVNAVGRIRDVRQGPDGYIYLAIDGDSAQSLSPVVRLEPVASDIATPQ